MLLCGVLWVDALPAAFAGVRDVLLFGVLWVGLVWCVRRGHEATDTGLAYAPVSQAHGHHHSV